MNLSKLYIATVVDDGLGLGSKSYKIERVNLARHGSRLPDILEHFSSQAVVGRVFEAFDIKEAEQLAKTRLPNPSTLIDFAHIPNHSLTRPSQSQPQGSGKPAASLL